MNLIVDVGNTYAKLAVFDKGLLYKDGVTLSNLNTAIKSLKKKYPAINNGIISSVVTLQSNQLEILKHKAIKWLILAHNTKVPFKNNYQTIQTLGLDRIALVSSAAKQFTNNNVLVIDAGTCITYDFLSAENLYLGGSISPGIRMRYKALHNLTANLPLLDTTLPNTFIGKSTASSIHSGVVNGVVNEIDGFVVKYMNKFSDLTVILTGGDAKFLSKQLKSSIFANSNFLLEGLNYILEFNTN